MIGTGIGWRVSPQSAGSHGAVPSRAAGRQASAVAVGQRLPGVRCFAMVVHDGGRILGRAVRQTGRRPVNPAAILAGDSVPGSGNAVSARGAKLVRAPDAPGRSAVTVASRQASVTASNGGLLLVTFIRRETSKACASRGRGRDTSRVWLVSGCEQVGMRPVRRTTGLINQVGGDGGGRGDSREANADW